MRPDGMLTTVDLEAEHQRLAKEAFTEAGIPPQRVRLIPGAALDVLPRLTDGHYDLVFGDGDKTEYADYLDEALRLLKPGGIVAFDNALWHDRVADPAQRDAETVAIRELCKAVPTTSRCCPCCSRSATGSWSRRRSGRPRPEPPGVVEPAIGVVEPAIGWSSPSRPPANPRTPATTCTPPALQRRGGARFPGPPGNLPPARRHVRIQYRSFFPRMSSKTPALASITFREARLVSSQVTSTSEMPSPAATGSIRPRARVA